MFVFCRKGSYCCCCFYTHPSTCIVILSAHYPLQCNVSTFFYSVIVYFKCFCFFSVFIRLVVFVDFFLNDFPSRVLVIIKCQPLTLPQQQCQPLPPPPKSQPPPSPTLLSAFIKLIPFFLLFLHFFFFFLSWKKYWNNRRQYHWTWSLKTLSAFCILINSFNCHGGHLWQVFLFVKCGNS